jgi:hypothetical protein
VNVDGKKKSNEEAKKKQRKKMAAVPLVNRLSELEIGWCMNFADNSILW